MGEINLSRSEKDAIASIDISALRERVDQAIRSGNAGDLHHFPLNECGSYVSAKLSAFQRALVGHSRAKTPPKRAETGEELQRASSRLTNAVLQMKSRTKEEEKEGQLFYVYDDVLQPTYLSDQLNVRVSYRWRKTIGDEWNYGIITFAHVLDTRPDYRLPVPKRKPSTVKQERELQRKRSETWEHLMQTALYTVRDFFRGGGNGSAIPETFRAMVDHSGFLNNHSARFWSKAPDV